MTWIEQNSLSKKRELINEFALKGSMKGERERSLAFVS